MSETLIMLDYSFNLGFLLHIFSVFYVTIQYLKYTERNNTKDILKFMVVHSWFKTLMGFLCLSILHIELLLNKWGHYL